MGEIYQANDNKHKTGILASDNLEFKAKITKRNKEDILKKVIVLQKYITSKILNSQFQNI